MKTFSASVNNDRTAIGGITIITGIRGPSGATGIKALNSHGICERKCSQKRFRRSLNPFLPALAPDQESPARLSACGHDRSHPARVRCSTDVWQRILLRSMLGKDRVRGPAPRQRWEEKPSAIPAA